MFSSWKTVKAEEDAASKNHSRSLFGPSAGWEGVPAGRAGVGQSEGLLLVARAGGSLENQVVSRVHAKGGVVRRRDVLRGERKRHFTRVERDFCLFVFFTSFCFCRSIRRVYYRLVPSTGASAKTTSPACLSIRMPSSR